MMYFDRFDICEAYYMFAVRFGFDSILRRLAKIEYRPGVIVEHRTNTLNLHDAESGLNENVCSIYEGLVKQYFANEADLDAKGF